MTEENGEARELPKGWELTTLAEIAAIKGGLTKDKKRKEKDCLRQVPYLRVANVQRGFLNLEEVYLIEATEDEIEELRLLPGDILFNEGGDRDKLGRGWIWNGKISECIHRNHVFRARPYNPAIQGKLISWYGNTFGQKYFIGEGKQTTNLASINLTKLSNFPIPLPSLNEQIRIVEKIEELFSDLDQGIETLKTAQKQLKVYRQAALKWAFEGKLTAQWREAQTDLATGETLLAQIKAERSARYQQKLAEWEEDVEAWEANGKAGKKPTKPQKPKELPPLTTAELAELPELPNGWCWDRYGSLCSEIRNGISERPDGESGEKILRISAVRPFFIDLKDYRYIANSNKYSDFLLRENDILFTRYNGSRRYVGVCARFGGGGSFLYPDKLIRTRLISCVFTIPSHITYAVNTGSSRKYIEGRIRTTAGQSGISGEDIKSAPVPISSPLEQNQIVQEIESRLSICDQLEATLSENLKKAEALRQSILKQAFEGKLVPQDPNDEPAEKLLERIKAERQAKRSAKQLRISL